jgi:hypothetical protein
VIHEAYMTTGKLWLLKFHLCMPLNNYKVLNAPRYQLSQPNMVTMADTAFHDPGVKLVPRASVPATEYAEYKAIRDKFKREALGQLEPAIRASTSMTLDGLPYPVKFRNQGALDEWQQLFKAHDWSQRMWDTWAMPHATCLDCINELCWHVDQRLHPHPLSQRPSDWTDTAFATVVRWAANIHFERKRGALIETTPALDTLLMHSDIDDTLPMHLFSPPFGAQYLHLNRATAEHFMTAEDRADQRWIDGIFCFVSKPSSSDDADKFIPVIELVIIYVAKDEGIRAQLLRGPMITPDEPVTQWADAILAPPGHQRTSQDEVLIKLISNMVKVFLYLGLKDARKEVSSEYSEALKRLAAVGPKKQAKVQRRLESLYDRITVGPASTPAMPAAPGTVGIRAPHWRRGHFRAQPCGPARSSRKLIFVAPILIHADRLGGQAPPPKAYELTTGRVRPSRAAGRQQQTKQRIQPRDHA